MIQIVTQVKSPENANKFVEDLTPTLESCRGKTLSDDGKGHRSGSQIVVDAVTASPNAISVTSRELGSRPQSCQHVFRSASSYILEISTCGNNISDQAMRIASMIAAKIDTP